MRTSRLSVSQEQPSNGEWLGNQILRTAIALLLLTATAWSNPFQDHLVKLLREHGEKHVITDSQGVGLPGQSARLEASLYQAKCDGRQSIGA